MKQLTTGEIARLLNVSKHTVRHYIDEGLLVPERNEENGYYYFDELSVYKLYQIIVFRNIGYSLAEIKAILQEKSPLPALKQAELTIQNQIDELIAIKATVGTIIGAQKDYKLDELVFLERDARYFKTAPPEILVNGDVDFVKAAKLMGYQLDEVYYVLGKNEQTIACFASSKELSDHQFLAGTYGCKSFIVEDESSVLEQIELFISDPLFMVNEVSLSDILIYENVYCSLAYNDVTIYTIEGKLPVKKLKE